jgi:hypothetical protein
MSSYYFNSVTNNTLFSLKSLKQKHIWKAMYVGSYISFSKPFHKNLVVWICIKNYQINLILVLTYSVSRCSSVCIVSAYGPGDRASMPEKGGGFFFYPLRPDRLWGPPSLLYNGYRGLFPRG